ncbi:MAG: dTDP-4-dehydrorhamnose 3,5-epimerase family protein [Candidatus Aenigmarchaeota archaeon]|nr:dTDP-4-dehydrorhamnose 3,5-epimerase family protein [Candidatus Aenigmarchaeota archaeon]
METGIEGLTITLNKVVNDWRGSLYELLPGGSGNQSVSDGIGNLYVSVGKKKFVCRVGHYHKNNTENFFTLGGATLWIFCDMRKGSKTEGTVFGGIFGDEFQSKTSLQVMTIDKGTLAKVRVPTGVWHAYWPITEKPSIIIAVGSIPYEKEDNEKVEYSDIDDVVKILKTEGVIDE